MEPPLFCNSQNERINMNKPEWLKAKAYPEAIDEMEHLLRSMHLHTVCENAACPNIGSCFQQQTATFMILGTVCTRGCRFCNVTGGIPQSVDENEPENVAKAVERLELKHVVVTSVTRDDLPDGGAAQFKKVINAIKRRMPDSTTEVLVPDFMGNKTALKTVLQAAPDILNHNVETVPRLYQRVRPDAVYKRSFQLLEHAKEINKDIFTKSGIMVGLGETESEVKAVMDDLIAVGCDVLTIGQYLRPSQAHIPVSAFIPPEQFKAYKETAYQKGFKFVASGPLVRSSFDALSGIKALRKG